MSPFENARWISGDPFDYGSDDAGYYQDHRNHIVSRAFSLAEVPASATLHVAVLGYGRVKVNGTPVSTDELLGDWTNYTKLVYYRSYEVASFLRSGDNRIDIELGNGWYNPAPLALMGNYNLRARLVEVGTPQVLASVRVGAVPLVESDASWTWREGSLLFNNLFLGERVDLRDFEAQGGPVVAMENTRTLAPAVVEPCRRFATVSGTDIQPVRAEGDAPAFVIDFHEEITGFLSLGFQAHEGDVVRIAYAESAHEDGTLIFSSNYAGMVGTVIPHAGPDGSDWHIDGGPGAPATGRETDMIICREGANRFENAFCTHSFRYAHIKGIRREALQFARATYVHTALPSAGDLSCGNNLLDVMREAAIRTKLNNVHGVWEDCAREHLGYGGDMVALADSNLLLFDCQNLIRKTVRDFRNDQTARGGVPETAPYMGIQSLGTGQGEGPLLWQIAYPYLVLKAYRYYGDRELVERELPYIRRQIDYLLSWDYEELAKRCLGDHGSIQTHKADGDWKGGTPDRVFTGWCAILWFARLGVQLCAIAGEPAAAYLAAEKELRAEIRKRFARKDGSFGDATQTSFAFAGEFGLMDRKAAGRAIAAKMAEEDDVLSAGIFGASFAWMLLHEAGCDKAAERWLLRKGRPSYREMLSNGNGALAEMFDVTFDSYNHAMFSSYVSWLYESLAGIRVADDAVGANHMVYAPYFSQTTNRVSASYETPAGTVSSSWVRGEKGIAARLSWPSEVALDIDVAGCSVVARGVNAAGEHELELFFPIINKTKNC